jgi:isopentenyldiphosphate isomerase
MAMDHYRYSWMCTKNSVTGHFLVAAPRHTEPCQALVKGAKNAAAKELRRELGLKEADLGPKDIVILHRAKIRET